jgi:cell shape-determining protein MreC
MIYLRTHSRGNRASRLVILLIAILAIVTGGIQLLFPHFFPALFTSIARPFWRMEFAVGSGSLGSPASLLSENEDLKRQLAAIELSMASSSTRFLTEENAQLKALFDRASSTPRLLAAVLERPPQAPYDSLVIDAGARDGVEIEDLVYADQIRVGTVSDVLGQTAKVTLFSSPGQTYNVLIGPGNAPAIATGRGGGQYEADLPRDVHIVVGDVVTAPSVHGGLFGVVTAVISNPSQAFEKILFAVPVNVYELKWVTIERD